jgi:hypothetical protein
VPAAEVMTQHLADVRGKLAATLEKAKLAYANHADKKRREGTRFKEGDLVLLSLRNIRVRMPSRKFGPLFSQPVRVVRVIKDSAVELELPHEMRRLHPVFHVSLVQPWHGQPPSQVEFSADESEAVLVPRQQLPVQIEHDGDVDMIVNSQWFGDEFKYRVKWVGDSPNTWESIADLWGAECSVEEALAKEVVERFHDLEPFRARPDMPPGSSSSAPAMASGRGHRKGRRGVTNHAVYRDDVGACEVPAAEAEAPRGSVALVLCGGVRGAFRDQMFDSETSHHIT